MNAWTHAASWACLAAGSFFCIVGAVGMLRMPDFYTRMHAASVIETLGAGLVLVGLMVQAGATLVAVKLLMVGALIFLASPTATHALARAAMVRGLKPRLADDGRDGGETIQPPGEWVSRYDAAPPAAQDREERPPSKR